MQAYKTQSYPQQLKINFSQYNQSKGQLVIDEELLYQPMEYGQVIVHFYKYACNAQCIFLVACSFIIDPYVFLLPNSGSYKSQLIQAVNVEVNKEIVLRKRLTKFSLIFEGLPKSATSFDFIEPCEKGWRVLNIQRNKTDVYVLQVKKNSIELKI